mgnify:CR=1 FL=1
MPNHYDNLPNELIFNIESFLETNPENLKEMIENPPMKYKKMLDAVCEFVDSKTWSRATQEEIDEENERRKQIRENYIKFFIVFDVISISKGGLSDRKAKKHGFIKSCKETFSFQTLSGFDHVREFTTKYKKHIVISSPYTDSETAFRDHSKYGFKKYHTYLHRKTTDTYVLILG